jgi:hypothetical protein
MQEIAGNEMPDGPFLGEYYFQLCNAAAQNGIFPYLS